MTADPMTQVPSVRRGCLRWARGGFSTAAERKSMFARVRRAVHAREEDGASAVEYALLVAAIAALIIVVVLAFGGLVRDIFQNTCNDLKDKTSTTTTSDCGNGSNGG